MTKVTDNADYPRFYKVDMETKAHNPSWWCWGYRILTEGAAPECITLDRDNEFHFSTSGVFFTEETLLRCGYKRFELVVNP